MRLDERPLRRFFHACRRNEVSARRQAVQMQHRRVLPDALLLLASTPLVPMQRVRMLLVSMLLVKVLLRVGQSCVGHDESIPDGGRAS